MSGGLRLTKDLMAALEAMRPKDKPKTLAEMVDPKMLADLMERQRQDARLRRILEMGPGTPADPVPDRPVQRLEDVPLAPGVESGPYVDTGPAPGQATTLPAYGDPPPLPEGEYQRQGKMHRTYFEIMRRKRPQDMQRALDPAVPDSDPVKQRFLRNMGAPK